MRDRDPVSPTGGSIFVSETGVGQFYLGAPGAGHIQVSEVGHLAGSPQHLGTTACLLRSSISNDILLKRVKEGVPSFQEEDGNGKIPILAVT